MSDEPQIVTKTTVTTKVVTELLITQAQFLEILERTGYLFGPEPNVEFVIKDPDGYDDNEYVSMGESVIRIVSTNTEVEEEEKLSS